MKVTYLLLLILGTLLLSGVMARKRPCGQRRKCVKSGGACQLKGTCPKQSTKDCGRGGCDCCLPDGKCPPGSFEVREVCFKLLADKERNWDDGKAKCEAEGLILAEPTESTALPLRKFLMDTYGDEYIWIGGRGTGAHIVWDYSKAKVDNESPLWAFGKQHNTDASRCMQILAWQSFLTHQPDGPYSFTYCTLKRFALC